MLLLAHWMASQVLVRVYLLQIEDLLDLAQTRVIRSLTTDECQKYLHMERCPVAALYYWSNLYSI